MLPAKDRNKRKTHDDLKISALCLLAVLSSLIGLLPQQPAAGKQEGSVKRSANRAQGDNRTKNQTAEPAANRDLCRVNFKISGPSCPDCLLNAERIIHKIRGVVTVRIDLRKPHTGIVIFDSSKIDLKTIRKKLARRDYQMVVLKKSSVPAAPADLVPNFKSYFHPDQKE